MTPQRHPCFNKKLIAFNCLALKYTECCPRLTRLTRFSKSLALPRWECQRAWLPLRGVARSDAFVICQIRSDLNEVSSPA